tara:strand:- start:182 stop:442 length:261 start_codon:yes stop_codon:yes gene_type:complete
MDTDKVFNIDFKKPTPIEIELQTELKVREIQNCENIEQLKKYAVAITKKNACHDYILLQALEHIIELEEKLHFTVSPIKKFIKKYI